jgi:hypothetical protein
MSASKNELVPTQEAVESPQNLDGMESTLRGDGTTVVGDGLGGIIKVDYKPRTPAGPNARARRVQEFPELLAAAMRNRAERLGVPLPTQREIDAEVSAQLADAGERRSAIEKALAGVAPESAAPDAATVRRNVETAAVLRLPVMVWAWFRLLAYSSGPKRIPMWRRLAVASALRMGFASLRPCGRRVLEGFCEDARCLAWTHFWPGHPPAYPRADGRRWELSAFHKQLKKVLGPGNPFRMWPAMNRELLLGLMGPHIIDERRGGQFKNIPDALTYLIADGFLIEADLPQTKPASEAHARMVRGEARRRCGFLVYKNGDFVTRKCHGYKWVQLSLLKLGGLVLHGKLFPANVDERTAVLELLAEAFRLWPELNYQKDIFLIGDALYDTEQFAYELTFRWGIHGVFPRAGTISSQYKLAATGGVPVCKCGRLATIDEANDFPTPWYRHRNQLPAPGDYVRNSRGDVLDAARIRWRCASKVGARCDFQVATYPKENPRLYTYLPFAGEHRRVDLRMALLCYRNVVESSFSTLKDMGLAGQSQARPKWADDDQMDHLVWMNVVAMTGRRMVHANGLYEQVFAEAGRLGLLTASTPTTETPAMFTNQEWLAWELSAKTYARAPTGWRAADHPRNEFHHVGGVG